MFLFVKLILTSVLISQICNVYCSTSNDSNEWIVVGNYSGTELTDDGCHYLLDSFATVSSNFTFCAIRNARPITLCQDCVDSYTLAVEVHRDILKLMDEAGELCKEKLLNLDRLQVVEGGFQFISGLWRRAGCDYCYTLDAEGNPEKLKSDVKKVLSLHNNTVSCIKNNMNDTELKRKDKDPQVCYECKQSYLELNALYNDLKDKSPFCMDIIDMVNTTRYLWSVTIGCCLDRQRPEVAFLITSGIISVLPVLFYLLACSFTGKNEDNIVLKNRSTSVSYPNIPSTAIDSGDVASSETSNVCNGIQRDGIASCSNFLDSEKNHIE